MAGRVARGPGSIPRSSSLTLITLRSHDEGRSDRDDSHRNRHYSRSCPATPSPLTMLFGRIEPETNDPAATNQ
jgi:hypothetical protein